MDRRQRNPEIQCQLQLFNIMKFYIALFIALLIPTMSHSAIVARAVTNVGDTAVDREDGFVDGSDTLLPVEPTDKLQCPYLAVDVVGTCSSITTTDSCYEPNCNCPSSTSGPNANHIITTTTQVLEGRVLDCIRRCTCVSSGRSTYSCASGYCGNPTSATSTVCKVIPVNGKCVSGVIQCNANYYKSNNLCVTCPANATCSGGTASFVCKTGYQKNDDGTACVPKCSGDTFLYNDTCHACPDNAVCKDNTFQCNDGYYFVANTSAPYCIECPEHASVCSGLTVNDIMCQSGYYVVNKIVSVSSGASVPGKDCKACPANATCAGGTAGFVCNIGYYSSGRAMVNGGGCIACPEGGTTDTTGSTSVSACKLVDGGTYFDNTGSYTISGGGCTYELTTAI